MIVSVLPSLNEIKLFPFYADSGVFRDFVPAHFKNSEKLFTEKIDIVILKVTFRGLQK